MRILVTGGAGFIGSHYVRSLLTEAYDVEPTSVVVLDKLTYAGNLANLDPVKDDARLRFVEGDILDNRLVDELMGEADSVVHFAAESHVDRSILGAADFVMTNVVGTQTLLDSALRHEVGKFVHVSTDEVYGSIEEGSWTEEQPLEPNSPYSASKAGSDLIARAYARTHGLDVSVTRCSNNYGSHQFPEKVIPLFVTNAIDGQRLPLYGDGLNVRDWLHVDDHCRAIDLLVERGEPGETYNIGGGQEVTNLELTRRILELTGRTDALIERVADRPGHDRRYALDIAKIAALGWRPDVPFDEGLAATVAWYRENEWWWRPIKQDDPAFRAYYAAQYDRRSRLAGDGG